MTHDDTDETRPHEQLVRKLRTLKLVLELVRLVCQLVQLV